MWENYKYCDVHLIKPSGQHTLWRRIERNRTEEWVNANEGALAYFSTIQSLVDGRKVEGDWHQLQQWSPMFFDLDDEERPERALDDARKLVDYFATGFDVEPKIWWSGGKGFHLLVPAELFAADPDPKLTYIWKHVANSIIKKLTLESLDWRVYSIARMWRIPNTIHHEGKDGQPDQYKIPVEPSDLAKGLDYIRDLARSPRKLWLDDEDVESEIIRVDDSEMSSLKTAIEPEPALAKLFQAAKHEYINFTKVEDYEAIEAPIFDDDHPACVAYFLEFGLGALGTKNRADMALSNYCKAKGMELRDATEFMTAWASSIPVNLTHVSDPNQRIIQTMRVLRTVYAGSMYNFSCGSMRSCEISIDCRKCDIEQQSQAIVISLADFSKAENFGRRVVVEADVVGRDSSELIIPIKIVGGCGFSPDTAICMRCKMGDYINEEKNIIERTMVFDANQPKILDLIDVTTAGVHSRVQRLFGVEKRCYSFKYEAEMGNANIIYLSSRLSGEFNPAIEEQMARTRAIYLDHEIELNRGYNLHGVVWSHPRTGKAVFLVDELEQLQSTLSTFMLAPKRLDDLKIFQITKEQKPLDKIKERHKIFNTDFVRVWGREELIMATDLVFHSVRRFNFQKTIGLKAWLDILILGDTRQGKSDVVEKMMRYYGLGVLAAGETASRTGLLYTIRIVQGEEAWVAFGLLPRMNGYLVVIDEIHGMRPEDFREFTLVRSKGVVDVKRTAYGSARAETRLISIANARPGKALASYGYPVQAIPDIPCFQALEDVSRFDFCVGVRAGDVTDDIINTDVEDVEEVDNPYTSELCHDLIMWLWTRQPDQIKMSSKTERVILDLALEISQDYIPDIPLVESADIRHKLARMAASIAGMVYSTNDGENLIIKPTHARAARQILDEFYKAPGLNYYGWSDEHKRIIHSEQKLIELRFDFKAAFISKWEDIAKWILDSSDFNKAILRTSCGLESKETDQVMAFLITCRFVVSDRYKYIKTPAGRVFLQSLFDEKTTLLEVQDEPAMDDVPEQLPEATEGDDEF